MNISSIKQMRKKGWHWNEDLFRYEMFILDEVVASLTPEALYHTQDPDILEQILEQVRQKINEELIIHLMKFKANPDPIKS